MYPSRVGLLKINIHKEPYFGCFVGGSRGLGVEDMASRLGCILWKTSSVILGFMVGAGWDGLSFIAEVMDLVELTPLRDALDGLAGVNGLSNENRKRLIIAVELVANPYIIFMDESTSGLDARAAPVVMRTFRNTVDTTLVLNETRTGVVKQSTYAELSVPRPGTKDLYFPTAYVIGTL
ncbi:pleiotropic drug resistance protein 1-like protein [Tanacetum coccineum]